MLREMERLRKEEEWGNIGFGPILAILTCDNWRMLREIERLRKEEEWELLDATDAPQLQLGKGGQMREMEQAYENWSEGESDRSAYVPAGGEHERDDLREDSCEQWRGAAVAGGRAQPPEQPRGGGEGARVLEKRGQMQAAD